MRSEEHLSATACFMHLKDSQGGVTGVDHYVRFGEARRDETAVASLGRAIHAFVFVFSRSIAVISL